MTTVRIALANLSFPESPDDSVKLAKQAIIDAAEQGAAIICFPECYVPGYRAPGRSVPPPDGAFLKQAWQSIAQAAGKANIAVVLGTERTTNDQGDDLPLPRPAALIINNDGSIAGFQEKVQIPPEEDGVYCAGAERYVFACGPLKFGVVICHEGWRYPETVRFAARRGAHLVFHPHFHEPETGGYVPSTFAHPDNTFHEKAILCRAAENTCFFASVNCAVKDSPTTSAVANPDGTLLCYQPYGKEGILLADIKLEEATGLLASRCKYN